MLKKVILLVAIVAIVASTQVFAADEAAPAKAAPAPARERATAPGTGAGGGAGMRGMGGMGMGGMGVWGILPQLNLTEEQKTKADALRTTAMEKMQAAGPALMAAQTKVTELVNTGAADDAIKTAAADYSKLYVEQAMANAATMRTLRNDILKPEQVTEMDKVMKERAAQRGNMMGGGRTRGTGGAAGGEGAAPAPRPARPANGGQN